MQICKMRGRQINQALELIRKVFDECDKEDYEDMGILSFYHFIRREQIEERVKSGEMVFFGAYEESELVGVIAMREGFHVSLLFVEKKRQRQGIGKKLIRRGVAYCLEKKSAAESNYCQCVAEGKKSI